MDGVDALGPVDGHPPLVELVPAKSTLPEDWGSDRFQHVVGNIWVWGSMSMEVKPSQMAVWRHGWSWMCLVAFVRLHFSSVNNFAWSWCRHSKKCQWSSGLHWHNGHRVDPLWGCAFEVSSGSLSLMNRRMRCCLPGWNNDMADCMVGQLTLLRSC